MDLRNFDPNGVGQKSGNLFGVPSDVNSAQLIIIPMPWEVTVSYRTGTALGPEEILTESLQVDLFDPDYQNAWQKGYYILPIEKTWQEKSDRLRNNAQTLIEYLENGGQWHQADSKLLEMQQEINEEGEKMVEWIYRTALNYLNQDKKVALLGGDHSTPLGLIKAVAEKERDIGVLQIDAHADLRMAYEGFTYSHASISYNILNNVPQVKKLIQLGTRDFGYDEYQMIKNDNRITTFFYNDIKRMQYEGRNWKQIVDDIIITLPKKLFITFDIDGLDPKLCPNTGTPVPGGFETEQIFYLLKRIKEAQVEIVGFDLNEVSINKDNPGIDAIVGARVLYKLCNLIVS